MSAGATPKLMASTSESSCSPNSLPVPVKRATRPSNMSAKAARTMSQPAISNAPREAETIAQMPRNRLPSVKALGRTITPRCRRRRAPVFTAAPRWRAVHLVERHAR